MTQPRRPEEDVGLRLLARMIARAHLKRIAERDSPEAVGVEAGIDSLGGEGHARQDSPPSVQRKRAKARRELTRLPAK